MKPARPHRASGVRCALLALVAVCAAAGSAAATPLAPLLSGPGSVVTLIGSDTYTISEYALTSDKTIQCNGARIRSTGGPIRVSGAGVRLVVDDCRIDGTGWALLGALDGAQLVVQSDTRLTGNGDNTGIYLAGASLDVTGGRIEQCQWGVQMENADAALHGVVVATTKWAVQNVAGSVTLDQGCDFTNLDAANSGAAVSLIGSPSHPTRAASAVIHDSTFTGFGNAVDVQPTVAQGLPRGTVEVVGSTFVGAVYSALAVVDGADIRVSRTRVVDAQTDGIYVVNSTGVIEDTQVVGSLNTGVTFWGCPDGFTMRSSLVRGSVHQGVAVVRDPATGRGSHGVRILDNTIDGNAIANLFVDDASDAVAIGNVLTGAPDMSVRLHGSPGLDMIGGLLLDSHGGLEVKDGADATVALSAFTRHQRYGALVYANGAAAFSHSAFEGNGLDPAEADPSLVADTGGRLALARSALGPAGGRGLYNNAGNAATAAHTFWGDASGPRLLPSGGGAGASVGANQGNGSSVTIDPVLTTPPLDFRLHDAFALAADATTVWQPDVGLSLGLTGAPGVAAVPAGLVAALRLRDTSTLLAPAPPVGTAPDGVVAVWVEFDLLASASAGALRIRTAGSSMTTLSRLAPGGQWVPVNAVWDDAAGELVYAPADVRTLQGVFAFGNGQGCATAQACLESLLTAQLCAEPLTPKLQKAIARRLRAALAKLARALAATKPTRAARFVEKARKALQAIEILAAKAAQAKKTPISPACVEAIGAALRPAQQRIEAGAL